FEALKSLKESLEITGRIIDVLEKSGISVKDLHLALPTLIAIVAMGAEKDPKEAARHVNLLCNSAREMIEELFG
ncbi:MAG: hypothetical protein QXV75_08280, partial [Candidatus Bathyarchaeia archaeon]